MELSKWTALSLAAQLGNIGSELCRAKHWETQNDSQLKKESLIRALELIDLTIKDSRWLKRLKEIVRLREVVAAWFCDSKAYRVSPDELVDYCTAFALHERRNS